MEKKNIAYEGGDPSSLDHEKVDILDFRKTVEEWGCPANEIGDLFLLLKDGSKIACLFVRTGLSCTGVDLVDKGEKRHMPVISLLGDYLFVPFGVGEPTLFMPGPVPNTCKVNFGNVSSRGLGVRGFGSATEVLCERLRSIGEACGDLESLFGDQDRGRYRWHFASLEAHRLGSYLSVFGAKGDWFPSLDADSLTALCVSQISAAIEAGKTLLRQKKKPLGFKKVFDALQLSFSNFLSAQAQFREDDAWFERFWGSEEE